MDASIPARGRRAASVALTASFLALLAVPHLTRIRQASLYSSDDASRIVDLRNHSLGQLLFRPFNEHMAPFFEAVSWATWRASGRDLTRAPLAFTLASYVPFALALGLLARWIRRELGSPSAALACCALFALSPVDIEAAYWYSASSFTWALAWTLVALIGAGPAEGGRGRAGRLALFAGSLLAPASSAIGLLAGPLATVRLAFERRDRRAGWPTVLLPLAGTLAYLGACSMFRYDVVLKVGLRGTSDKLGGLLLALRAPTARLLPGTLGVADVDLWFPAGLNLAISGVGLVAILAWAARGRRAGLILTGLGLIVGGYALTYPFRNIHGPRWLLQVERFHLFPLLGLVVLIGLAGRRWLVRLDRAPLAGLAAANVLAGLLLAANLGRFESQFLAYRFPEQGRTLAALERLGELCRAHGVTRIQCASALEPVWSHWFQRPFNGLWLVSAPDLGPIRPDPEVRRLLLGALSAGDRRALWGGMDVSPLARPAEDLAGPGPDCLAVGRLVESDHARYVEGPPDRGIRRYELSGWPASLEFELSPPDPAQGPGAAVPRFLVLRCGPSAEPLEIAWAAPGEGWTTARSVRFQPGPAPGPRDWAFPLDRLPHWDPAVPGRIRIRFVSAPLAIGEPRLLR